MAAPMKSQFALQNIYKILLNFRCFPRLYPIGSQHMSFISRLQNLRRKKQVDERDAVHVEQTKLPDAEMQTVRKRKCIEEKRSYKPPADVMTRIQSVTMDVFGKRDDWQQIALTDRVKKFELLTKVMKSLDHDIPNVNLNDMNTLEDVVSFFRQEVKDTSILEDLSKLDLPKNLHMNLEPIRFHPDTDKAFGGVTAFPGSATKVTSIKYRRKYKGFSGIDVVNFPEGVKGWV